MVELRISYRAEKDLDDIRDHGVRQFGAAAAIEYLVGFYRVFARLRDHRKRVRRETSTAKEYAASRIGRTAYYTGCKATWW